MGKIIRTGPAGIGTLFTSDERGNSLTPTPAMLQLQILVAERRPAMLIVDPLAELHTAEENDNTALRAVVAEFRAIAVKFNIAVIIVHHTRKGALAPGDPDSARGASAIVGAGRIVLTVFPMSEKDAEGFGLTTDRKSLSRYVRLNDAKQNYCGIGDDHWYEKVLYTLANGEVVPAAVPWQSPNLWDSISATLANAILDEIEAGLDGGHRYSDAGSAKERGAYRVVIRHDPSLSEQQARKIIKNWVELGVLVRAPYNDKAEGKNRQGLRVNNTKRPRTNAS